MIFFRAKITLRLFERFTQPFRLARLDASIVESKDSESTPAGLKRIFMKQSNVEKLRKTSRVRENVQSKHRVKNQPKSIIVLVFNFYIYNIINQLKLLHVLTNYINLLSPHQSRF